MTAQELVSQFRYCKLIFASDCVGYCWLADYYEEPQVRTEDGEEVLFVTYGDGCMATRFKTEVDGDQIRLLQRGCQNSWDFVGNLVVDTKPRDVAEETNDFYSGKKRMPFGVSDGSEGCYF